MILPLVELVEPHDEVDQGGLARAGGTDDRHGLTGLGDERQVGDQRALGVVGERHVFELDPPGGLGSREGGLGRLVRRLLGGVEELEDPLGRSQPGLEQVGHRRQHLERLGKLPGVLDEGLDAADAQGSGSDPHSADHRDGDVVEVADHDHEGLDAARDELSAEAGPVHRLVGLAEGLFDLTLAPEGLHDGVAGERLLDQCVELPPCSATAR